MRRARPQESTQGSAAAGPAPEGGQQEAARCLEPQQEPANRWDPDARVLSPIAQSSGFQELIRTPGAR